MKTILVLLVATAVSSASARYQYIPEVPRLVRDTEPLWLYRDDVPRGSATGDHPIIPQYIDDIKLDPNRRTVRSLSTPSAPGGHHPGDSRSGGGHRGSQDTGTRLGPNQRYARSVEHHEREVRDVGDLFKKPSHRDVIIPNWNPHIKSNPWGSLRPKY